MLDWLKQIFFQKRDVAHLEPNDSSFTGSNAVQTAPRINAPSANNSKEIKEQGDAFLGQGNLGAAANCYLQAIAIDTNYAKAHSNLGFVYLQQGLPQQAEQSLKRALALDPDNADTCFMLGNLVIPLHNDLERGCAYLQRAVELAPDFDIAYQDWRRYMVLRGQLDQVKRALMANSEKHPNRADFHYYLGTIHQDEQDFDSAMSCLEKALALNPDSVSVLEDLPYLNLLARNANRWTSWRCATFAPLFKLRPVGHIS